MNNNIIKDKNRSNSIIFLTKLKNLAKFKNLFKYKKIKAIKKPGFLTPNIREIFNFLIF